MKKLFRLHNKRLSSLAAIVLAASVLLVACAGPAASPTAAPTAAAPTSAPTTAPTTAPTVAAATEAPTTAPATATVAAATEAPTTAAASATPGTSGAPSGELRVAMQPVVTTDAALISSDSEVMLANAVYDYLVDVDTKSAIQPRLATKWTVSADGLTYTLDLAQGVTFHDGSPFSSKDVVWTFNRLRDTTKQLPTADLYKNIAKVAAAGDNQVIFTLTTPNPFFLYDLSDNHALILKADTADPTDFNGTGSF